MTNLSATAAPAVVFFTVLFTAQDCGGSQSWLETEFPTRGMAEEAARAAAALDPDYCAYWEVVPRRKELWQYHADQEAAWVALLQG